MHFPNVNITVEALFLLYSQEKCGAFFSYNLHKKIRVPHLWRKITWSIWDPSVFKMAAKSEFSKNHKKIRFVDISEISPERYITGHKETIESLKNWVNFPESCPLILWPKHKFLIITLRESFWVFLSVLLQETPVCPFITLSNVNKKVNVLKHLLVLRLITLSKIFFKDMSSSN